MTTSASNKEEKESGRQWLRKCSLLVGKGSDGLELGELRIVFKTTKGDIETPNSAEIAVYNLSEATSSKIRKEFTRVVLQAGYQDNCAVIFDGTIRQVRRFRENGTDVCTSILAADGDAAYNYAVVNTTLAAGSTSAEHVGACQKAFSGKGADAGYIPDMAGPAPSPSRPEAPPGQGHVRHGAQIHARHREAGGHVVEHPGRQGADDPRQGISSRRGRSADG